MTTITQVDVNNFNENPSMKLEYSSDPTLTCKCQLCPERNIRRADIILNNIKCNWTMSLCNSCTKQHILSRNWLI